MFTNKYSIWKTGDNCVCLKNYNYDTKVSLSTWNFGNSPSFSVLYKHKNIYKIMPSSKKEQKLNTL